jgi:hypothetical protein
MLGVDTLAENQTIRLHRQNFHTRMKVAGGNSMVATDPMCTSNSVNFVYQTALSKMLPN